MRNPALNIAIKAARKAGDRLARLYGRHDLQVSEKAQHDFVTEADKEAEFAIVEEIRRAHPDHSFLTEESGDLAGSDTDHLWVIDPLDGTQNFLRGIPHFCTSIALHVKGQAEVAVVYDPIRDELFAASKGGGATLDGRKMRVAGKKNISGSLLGTGFPFRHRHLMPAYLAMFSDLYTEAADVRRAGSAALDLAYVAAGRLDGFWEIGLQTWDTAAGALLIREAGGHCMDFAGRHHYPETGNIIAGNVKVAESIRRTIDSHLVEGIRR